MRGKNRRISVQASPRKNEILLESKLNKKGWGTWLKSCPSYHEVLFVNPSTAKTKNILKTVQI
jgi:hypothetical protein